MKARWMSPNLSHKVGTGGNPGKQSQCLYAGHVGANSSAIWNAQDESDAARGVQERPVALD